MSWAYTFHGTCLSSSWLNSVLTDDGYTQPEAASTWPSAAGVPGETFLYVPQSAWLSGAGAWPETRLM